MLDAPILEEELKNCSVVRNQSEKDEQHRIFQFSPLSSKKQFDEESEHEIEEQRSQIEEINITAQ